MGPASIKILGGLAEGQVLQRMGARGATARLRGACSETGPVLATVADASGGALASWKQRTVGSARGGAFSAHLRGVPAGGPYSLLLRCGAASTRIKAFYCGDVWLLAGQSNMEGVGDMSGAAKPHPLVRVFSMARQWRLAKDPLHVLPESPDKCHNGGDPVSPRQAEILRREAKKGVGVGVFFAREMLARTGVPQGLIATAHGGTSMAQWDPALKGRGGASLYGSMLLSLRATAQPVAGVLWYQGESDTRGRQPDLYKRRMRTLVAALRRDLRQARLPWIMVQLAAVYGNWGGPRWNAIQEAQRRLPSQIRHLELISAIDLPLDDNIHIGAAGFQRLAARLARAAARLVHADKKEASMPRLRAILPPRPGRSHIEVIYDHAVGGLRSAGEAHGFVITDTAGRPTPCIHKTTLHGSSAHLHIAAECRLPRNARLAYGLGKTPICTITDARDCALPVFGPKALQ